MSREYATGAIVEALRDADGLISLAAKRLGCSANTIYRRAERVPSVRQVIDEARAELVDNAEAALRKAVDNGAPWAVALVLRTLGKDRGYCERQEVATMGVTAEVVTRVVRVKESGDGVEPVHGSEAGQSTVPLGAVADGEPEVKLRGT